MDIPSVQRLRQVFDYDPYTGILTWRFKISSNIRIGDVAGCDDGRGRLCVRVNDVLMLVHRVAWAVFTGHHPDNEIDHRDGDPSNNRIQNLRNVCHTVNMQNMHKARKDNKTGFLGVMMDKKTSRFRANISINGRQTNLGTFATAEEAHAVYVAAKRRFHEGCTL